METTVALQESTPEGILRALLLERRQHNPRYSLRALARDLDLSHGFLSLAMSGKRKLSPYQTLRLAKLARLNARDTAAMIGVSADKRVPRTSPIQPRDFFKIELDRFDILTEPHHLWILDLTLIEGFQSDPKWIARRLGLTVREVKQAVARLIRVGMLKEEGARWVKSERHISFQTKHSVTAIRQYHKQMIARAAAALDSSKDGDFARRDITGMLIPVAASKIPQAKKRIEKFRRDLLRFLSDGKCTQLYHLNVQLFPLTRGKDS